MSDFEHNGEELREQLHAIVEDLHPSAELAAAVNAFPSAHRGRRGGRRRLPKPNRIAIAMPVPIAGIAAAAVLLFAAVGPSSSIAGGIIVLRNGAIRVTPALITDTKAANAVLRRHHVYNIVFVPMTASCPYQNWSYERDPLPDGVQRAPFEMVTPATSKRGSTTVMSAELQGHGRYVLNAAARFRGHKLPTCASPTGPGSQVGYPIREPKSRIRR